MRDSKKDNDGTARSLFLAALMIGSVMVGVLFSDIESERGNLAPIIEADVPDSILIGTVDTLEIFLEDEDMSSLDIEMTLDGNLLNIQPNATGIIIVDISEILVGTHALKIVVVDSLGQESRLSTSFTIHYPYEDPTVMIVDTNEVNIVRGDSATINGTLVHPNLETCDMGWSDGDVNDFSLNLPFSDGGDFSWGPSEIESNVTITIIATCGTWEDSSDIETIFVIISEPVQGCTDSEANNHDTTATEDDGSCEYDEEPVSGCTDSEANNYDSTATEDDGSCSYGETTRLKILCLHGGGESASDFQSQPGMQDLIESLPEFEFIFAETREEGGVWVRDPPGGKEQGTNDPNWADGSITYLDDFIIENGPFYGLLGFSQGAAMSAIYLAYSDVEFEKVILFNGYLETGHQGLNDTIENESPFDIPALIFEGEDDDWFGYGSTELANIFIDATHVVGDAGHHLPYSSDREFDNVVSFIRDI
jgi:predicted esterase